MPADVRFQYPDFHFFDAPAFQFRATGAQAFFDATAYLALADYTAHPLTVYDGLSYGVENSVTAPEAPTSALLVVGFGLLAPAAAKRRPLTRPRATSAFGAAPSAPSR